MDRNWPSAERLAFADGDGGLLFHGTGTFRFHQQDFRLELVARAITCSGILPRGRTPPVRR
jgi:hypothetical protein